MPKIDPGLSGDKTREHEILALGEAIRQPTNQQVRGSNCSWRGKITRKAQHVWAFFFVCDLKAFYGPLTAEAV
jgi:hypothetical protein